MRKILNADLRLFDGEGGAGAAASGSAAAGVTSGEAIMGADSVAGNQTRASRRANNPLANVQYGKVEDAGTVDGSADQEPQVANAEKKDNQTSEQFPDKTKTFEQMITGEYKEQFDKRIQQIINKRFSETKSLQAQIEKSQPILEALASKYGIENARDVDAIAKAIDGDKQLYEQAALDKGLTVEQFKDMQRLERESRFYRQQQEEANRRANAERLYNQWTAEGQELVKQYPSFNLQAELANPEFEKMMSVGVSVKTAYEALHHDEILPAAMQYAAQTVAKKTADGIASKAARPAENGTSSRAAALIKSDVSKLTKADRAEIARRAARGEKTFF